MYSLYLASFSDKSKVILFEGKNKIEEIEILEGKKELDDIFSLLEKIEIKKIGEIFYLCGKGKFISLRIFGVIGNLLHREKNVKLFSIKNTDFLFEKAEKIEKKIVIIQKNSRDLFVFDGKNEFEMNFDSLNEKFQEKIFYIGNIKNKGLLQENFLEIKENLLIDDLEVLKKFKNKNFETDFLIPFY